MSRALHYAPPKRHRRTSEAPLARARNSYTSATSTPGSPPSVVVKRTVGVLSVRTVQGEVRTAKAPSEFALPYAALRHLVVGVGLMA
jgi:hypothetical protein